MPTPSWFDALKPAVSTLVDKLGNQLGNSLLQFDPETLARLEPFRGKVFRLDLTEPRLQLDLHPSSAGIRVAVVEETLTASTPDIMPDVTLQGSLWAFLRMAKSDDSKAAFHAGRVQMQGDAELGQAFQAVLADLDIDWEEVLSRFFGDPLAHRITQLTSQLRQQSKRNAQTARRNLGEVLQEELQLTPHPLEVDKFTGEVETLRSDVARLEARLLRLLEQRKADTQP